MIRDITLGQYFPGNSVIHKLDPRMKIILTLLFIVFVFLCINYTLFFKECQVFLRTFFAFMQIDKPSAISWAHFVKMTIIKRKKTVKKRKRPHFKVFRVHFYSVFYEYYPNGFSVI